MVGDLERVLIAASVFGALLACTTGACSASRPAVSTGKRMEDKVQHWRVFDDDQPIQEVSDVPGPLISVAAPPPGLRAVTHPFLSASSLSALHEHRLRQILVESKSVDDYLDRLRAAGFVVEQISQRPSPASR